MRNTRTRALSESIRNILWLGLGLTLFSGSGCSSQPTGAPDGATGPDLAAPTAPDAAVACEGADVFVAPTGSGDQCTCQAPCALESGRDRARQLAPTVDRDLIVQLAGGTYPMARTFTLSAADSGRGGHAVIYRAAPGAVPVLSGGVRITGLRRDVGDVYVATVPAGLRARQVYVNGRRATRARGPESPAGYTFKANGFVLGDAAVAAWPDRLGLEVVGLKEWKSFRCGVSEVSVAAGLVVQEPCWGYSQGQPGYTFDRVAWLENARELLDQPGEFYLDSAVGRLYYQPLPGEDPATADVVVPRLEELVRVAGTPAAPVHDVAFVGITFAHATWLGPSSSDGYAVLQAGITRRGAGGAQAKPLSHVTVHAGRGVRFSGCRFEHLGGVALALEVAAQKNVVESSVFTDISGSAVFVGDVTHEEDHHPTDQSLIVQDNTVRGCYITQVAAEYFDNVALFAGYTSRTTFDHNQIFDVPYTGISLGWGWGAVDVGGSAGYKTPTTAEGNRVTGNLISHHVRRLRDGGGVYVLGAQPGSVMQGNVIADQGGAYGNLYLDNGSSGWRVSDNLVLVPAKEAGTGVERTYWTYVQVFDPIARSNSVVTNYSNDGTLYTPRPIDASNVVQAALGVAQAPAGLRGQAGSALRSPEIARGRPATASSVYDPGHGPELGNNDNAYDGWSPSAADPAPYWQVDLGAAYAIDAVDVVSRWAYDQPVTRRSYRVLGALQADMRGAVELGQVGAAGVPHRAIWAREVRPPVSARYVRVEKTQPEYFFLADVLVHGVK